MKRFDLRIIWGGLLICAGGLFLLYEMNLIPSAWDFVWGLLFGVSGCVFLYAFWSNRAQWWTLIPGLGLISLAVLIVLDALLPGADWLGAIFLAGIGLSFWLIYAINTENWWAVIPGGVLVTLAIVAGIDPFVEGDIGGGIFMFGLGLTFGLLGVLPIQDGRMKWAFIPAVVLIIIGFFLISPLLPYVNYIWPLALIILGGYFIIRNLRS
ncbi:hypothetical protein AMJ86_02905 [bacterium SM23_57]|nr:MAG: hypothetical protein AMJ86_02905 [bacterium SM23_57]